LPGSACWDQRGVLRSFSWVSGPFLRDQLLAPRDQALVPRDQALFPALGSAPVLPPPPSPLGLLYPGTVFLAAGFYAGPPAEAFCPRGLIKSWKTGGAQHACAALPLPQSTLSSEPSSTPRLLWPPSRRAPVVPIRVCQHDDANRRNGQETEIGDRAGEGWGGWMDACMGTMQRHQRTVVCFVVLSMPCSTAL
jgi:hypothetical protein